MKTTKIFMMAALALTFAACSNDDNDMQNHAQQPQQAEGITITATLAPKTNGAATRKVSEGTGDAAGTIVAEWAVDEHIAILYNKDGAQIADATIKSVDANGVATIEFTVESGTANNTACTLVYPAKLSDNTTTVYKDDKSGVKAYADLLATQDGVLDGDLDVRVGAGTIQTTTPSLTVSTQPEAQYSIFKFTAQDISGTAITPSEFKVSDSEGNVITTVSPSASAFHVALPALSASTYWFSATASGKPYIAKATATATTAGKYYQTTVKMATIGDVILSDGKFAPSSSTGTKVAKIAYVGSETGETGYAHGLALAMSDAGSDYKWSTSNTDAHTTKQTSDTFESESGLQYNAIHNTSDYPAFQAAISNNGTVAPTGYSAWFLASGYQWKQMINAYGLDNLKATADGYTGLQSRYWSSTECDASRAWFFHADDGKWDSVTEGSAYLVRSCLAF